MSQFTLPEVLVFVANKHSGQIRKNSKEPYVNHPKRVCDIVKEYEPEDKILMAIALLHDTLEDTNTTYEELADNYGKEVANGVLSLTNDTQEKERLGKTLYLTNKLNALDKGCLLVKLADRLDNVSDLNSGDRSWSVAYARQTKYILDNLSDKIKTNNHYLIINRIRESIEDYV